MRLDIIVHPREPQAFDVESQPEVRTSDGTDDVVYNTARRLGLWVKNTTGSTINVTLPAQRECVHGDLHTEIVPVPNNWSGYIAQWLDYSQFNDPQNDVTIQYDASGLLIAALDLPA